MKMHNQSIPIPKRIKTIRQLNPSKKVGPNKSQISFWPRKRKKPTPVPNPPTMVKWKFGHTRVGDNRQKRVLRPPAAVHVPPFLSFRSIRDIKADQIGREFAEPSDIWVVLLDEYSSPSPIPQTHTEIYKPTPTNIRERERDMPGS